MPNFSKDFCDILVFLYLDVISKFHTNVLKGTQEKLGSSFLAADGS